MLTFDELDEATETLTGDDHKIEWRDVDAVLIVVDRVERANGQPLNSDQLDDLRDVLTAGPYRVKPENIELCLNVRNSIIAGRE